MSFPKIVNQMGSFGEKRKKNVFSLLSADSRYFRISALKPVFLLAATIYQVFKQKVSPERAFRVPLGKSVEGVSIYFSLISSNSLIIHEALTQPERRILVRWMGLETQ